VTSALHLAGVSKQYVLLEERGMRLRSLLPFAGAKRTVFNALSELDLEVDAGETVGIVGRNGAGKTTLLRLLAGVSRPSSGTVSVRGRVAPLLSVGVGFHQEMSGRENVYVNGMLLGLTKAQVEQRFDEIVSFAELEPFIDTPVKFYSSGMFMRLGFSVAIHVDPEVLLVDEVLAVGDLAFQLKCFDKMRELKDRGTTIVIVSHSMHAIRLLCPRAILLSAGRLEVDGPVEEVIARHHALLSDATEALPAPSAEGEVTVAGVRVVHRELVGPDGTSGDVVRGGTARLRFRLVFDVPAIDPRVHLSVLAEDRTVVYETSAALSGAGRRVEVGDEIAAEATFSARLNGGSFRLMLTVASDDGRQVLHRDTNGLLVYIPPVLGTSGLADLDATIALAGSVLTDHPQVSL